MVQHEGHEAYMLRRIKEEDSKREKVLTQQEIMQRDMEELTKSYYGAIGRIKELSEEVESLKVKILHYENNYTRLR